MIKGKTESGFKFEIDESIGDDMEFVEQLAQVDENPLLMPKILEEIMGKEQKEKLYDHLRDEKGKVSVQKVVDEFSDMLKAAGEELKNS